MNLKAVLPLMLFSSIGFAEEYQSFSDVDYSRTEAGLFELEEFTVGSTWYFDKKVTLGPLKEFEYINKTSNVFGSWSRFESTNDADRILLGGEYFAGNLLLSGSYQDLDGFYAATGTVGYLLNSNFLVSLDAVKVEGIDTDLVVNARYNHALGGDNYIGFNFSTDDDFDARHLSSRYFTKLAGENWLAAEVTWSSFDGSDDFWSLDGDYYFSERTSVGLGIAKDEVYSFDFAHFFNENVAIELGYTTSSNDDLDPGLDFDVDRYQLGMTVQF